jgi:hypothetical protein
VGNDAQNGEAGNLVAEETVGSVTIRIYSSPTRVKIPHPEAKPGTPSEQPDFEYRTYDSFIIPYYEGSLRKTPRRSTLDKAKAFAKETATRLNKDGARADFLSEKDHSRNGRHISESVQRAPALATEAFDHRIRGRNSGKHEWQHDLVGLL